MGRDMAKGKSEHPMRLPDSLWQQIGNLAESLGYKDGRGVHAALARNILAAAVAEWKESPYICRSAKHSFLITGKGVIFYRLIHVLHLNSGRKRLPCAISMKREKRMYFFRTCPPGKTQEEWFRSQWLINGFAVWQGQDVGGTLLAVDSDRLGTDVKAADLLIDQSKGRVVTREIVVAARDYVQWIENDKSGSDWVEIPVDMPTRNFEVEVFVDHALYSNSPLTPADIPDLGLEFRNRESARFANNFEIGRTPPIEELKGSFPNHNLDAKKVGEVAASLEVLRNRFNFFSNHEVEGVALLDEREREALRAALVVPENFLFYRMSWPTPHLGIEVCVGWDKPVKLSSLRSDR